MTRSLLQLIPQAGVACGCATVALATGAGGAAAAPGHHGRPPSPLHKRVFATGGTLTNPDDITALDGRVFVAWQNNTQPDGSGGGASTVVAYRGNGAAAGSWQIPGHVDGLTADPAARDVIATSNEDAHSSLYMIAPHRDGAMGLRRYTYSPDPSTLAGGGTDAISIVGKKILISASNPQNATGPAVFQAVIPRDGSVATLTSYFDDDSTATDAITGKQVTLHLTDPDSNAVVPRRASPYGGGFVLNSQGDSELIFAADQGDSAPSLTVLNLNAGSASSQAPQVDDVRWASSPHGTLLATDGQANKVYAITGSFGRGAVLTAIPNDSPSLGGNIGTIDLASGTVTPIVTGLQAPKGLLYLPGHAGREGEHRGDRFRHAAVGWR